MNYNKRTPAITVVIGTTCTRCKQGVKIIQLY